MKLPAMKENLSYRRVSIMSIFAVLACVIMILVQLFFMLEIYRMDLDRLPVFLQGPARRWLVEVPEEPVPAIPGREEAQDVQDEEEEAGEQEPEPEARG